MSSYVDSVLADDERIIYRAAISHWKFFLSYLVGGLFLLAALGAYVAIGEHVGSLLALVTILVVIGLTVILSAVIRRQTTELVLTDRRIITKRGLVSRNTVEMNLNKVESLHVEQGLIGRILKLRRRHRRWHGRFPGTVARDRRTDRVAQEARRGRGGGCPEERSVMRAGSVTALPLPSRGHELR